MKRLTHSAGLAVVAGLALVACPGLSSTAEAAGKEKVRNGVVTFPVAYDTKTHRLSDVVMWWSEANGGSHRAQLVTMDLDVVTPAKLANVRSKVKARLEAGQLEARIQEGFEQDLESLKDLPGGTSTQTLTDQHLKDLLGTPGVRLGNTTLAGDLNGDFLKVAGGLGGTYGLVGLNTAAAATGVSGPMLGGAFAVGVAMGAGINELWDATLSVASGGEVNSLGDAAYEIWCADASEFGCDADDDEEDTGDGTTLPPDMGEATAGGLMSFYLATGLGADDVERQLNGLDIAGGADVGVTREREDLEAWLAIDARLGGEFLRQVERGLDARGSQHGIRDNVQTGGAIDPNQIFNFGRITPMPEMELDVRGVRPH